MKKVTVFAVSILFAGIASAQDLTSKKGETILPEEGDYALGFDAAPFLNYVGNFLNQAGNNAPGADYVNGFNQTIVGKMFKDAQTAYRAKVRLGFGSTTRKNLVNDDANTTDPNARVEDEQKSSYTSVTLGAGLEKRRGNTRVQGLFGGEVLVGFTNRNTTSTFGNSFSTTNTMPTSTTNFLNGTSGPVNVRSTEQKIGSTISFQLRGFVGVELFVLPKTSIGMEFGWGPRFVTTAEGENSRENWNAGNNSVQSTTTRTAGGSSLILDTDNAAGSLTINFHF